MRLSVSDHAQSMSECVSECSIQLVCPKHQEDEATPTYKIRPHPPSSSSTSRESTYIDRFSAFPSNERSCENLHLSPLVHCPCLKNRQSTDFGSAPLEIFCCTGRNKESNSVFSFRRSTLSFCSGHGNALVHSMNVTNGVICTLYIMSRVQKTKFHTQLNDFYSNSILSIGQCHSYQVCVVNTLAWNSAASLFCWLEPPNLTWLVTCLINCCCFFPFLFFRPNVLSCRAVNRENRCGHS